MQKVLLSRELVQQQTKLAITTRNLNETQLIMGDSQSTSNYIAIQCNRDLVAQAVQKWRPYEDHLSKVRLAKKWHLDFHSICCQTYSAITTQNINETYRIMGDSQSTSNYLAIQCNQDPVAQAVKKWQPKENYWFKVDLSRKLHIRSETTSSQIITIPPQIHAAKNAGCH